METAEAKRKLLKYLSMNQSIVWFPEGTWNLTPNLLMLPMKWGIIEVADQANAQIIPVVLDFNRAENVGRVKFADPIAGNVFKDKTEAIRLLRDTMSSLRWEMISNKPVLSRAEADFEMPQSEIKKSIAEYSALDWEYEKSCIYVPPNHIAPYMAFEYLRDLIPCRENAFLLRRRYHGRKETDGISIN